MHSRFLSERGRRQPARTSVPQAMPDDLPASVPERRVVERRPSQDGAPRMLDEKLLLHLAAQVDRLVADSEALKEQVAQVAKQKHPDLHGAAHGDHRDSSSSSNA